MTETKEQKGAVIAHRRGRIDNHQTEFKTEKEARDYLKENKLMVVHEDTDDQGRVRLYYLPE